MLFKSLEQSTNPNPSSQNGTEEKKEEQKSTNVAANGEQKVNVEEYIEKAVAQKPWMLELDKVDSNVFKTVNSATNYFTKRNMPILLIANALKVSKVAIKDIHDLPMIENDNETLFAIIFQNVMQPKNHQRRDAISSKAYIEIKNKQDAVTYLSKLLTSNLRNEIASKET